MDFSSLSSTSRPQEKEGGKKSNLITEPIIQIIISLTFKDKKDTNYP